MSNPKKPPPFRPGDKERKTVAVPLAVYEAVEEVRQGEEIRLGVSLPVGEFFAAMALRGADSFKQENRKKK